MKWKKFEKKVMEELDNLSKNRDYRMPYLYGMQTTLLLLRTCSRSDQEAYDLIWQLTDKLDEITRKELEELKKEKEET